MPIDQHDAHAGVAGFAQECPTVFRVPSSDLLVEVGQAGDVAKGAAGRHAALVLPPPQRRRRGRPKPAGHVTLRGKPLLGQEVLQCGHLATWRPERQRTRSGRNAVLL